MSQDESAPWDMILARGAHFQVVVISVKDGILPVLAAPVVLTVMTGGVHLLVTDVIVVL